MTTLNLNNPLLRGSQLPGDTVRLPSRGIFYNHGELTSGVANGEVHVYPMRAIDEIIMRSPDKLLSGDAIKEVFGTCIPELLQIDNLFAKDIDYLMLALRRVSYGNDYEFFYTHKCEHAKKHSYIADITQMMNKSVELDPVSFDQMYTYEVARTKNKVKFQPLKFKELVEIMGDAVEDRRDVLGMPDGPERRMAIFKTLVATINNVDGIVDRVMIVEWLSTLTAKEIREMTVHIETISDWGPKYVLNIQCKDCQEIVETSVPINPLNFFI